MFDVKGVDWNAMYDSLYPLVSDSMDADSLFSVCATLLNSLHDGHVNLYGNYDVSRSDSIQFNFYAQSDIDVNTVVLNYMGLNYHMAGGLAHSGLCGDSVIYIRYGSFSNAIGLGQLRHLLRSYPHAQGMIFDIRGNGGGNIQNIHRFLSLMPSHGQPLYTTQIKSGPGPDDFTPLQTTYAPLVADGDTDIFTKPVIVLIDRGCFSAASSFAICTQAYDNITLMGDTTSGGLGLPGRAAQRVALPHHRHPHLCPRRRQLRERGPARHTPASRLGKSAPSGTRQHHRLRLHPITQS